MENENKITPVGLKGREINERMIQLMGIKPINENNSKSVVELTKIGPDGIAYAIVRENHEYYIKTSTKKSNLITEDFGYIGGLQNKKSEVYPSYAKAIKHLNLKFNSLSESLDKGHNINVFENDNLLKENGIAGFSNYSGNGFSGQGNLDGDASLFEEEEKVEEDVELTEVEQAVEDMGKDDIDILDATLTSAGYEKLGYDENYDRYNYRNSADKKKEIAIFPAGGFKDKLTVLYTIPIDSYRYETLNGIKLMNYDFEYDSVKEANDDLIKVVNNKINETKLTINRALKNMDSIIDNLTEDVMARDDEDYVDEEWKSDFDGNSDFDEYYEDKVEFVNKYGSVYDIVNNLDADISIFDSEIEDNIFGEFLNNELNRLTKFNLPKGQNLNGEKISFKSSPNGQTLSANIYTLPNNKYGFYSENKDAYLMGDNKEQIIKLAAIEEKLFDYSRSASIDKQTSRGESGWVDETNSFNSMEESIKRLDKMITSLSEGTVKKKVYTLK